MWKFRYLDKRNLIILFLIVSLGFFSWAMMNDFYYIFFELDVTTSIDLKGFNQEEVVRKLFHSYKNWESFVSGGAYYQMYLLPLCAVFPVVRFKEEIECFYRHTFSRINNHKKYIVKSLVQISLASGCVTALGFTLFYTIGTFFIKEASLTDIGGYTDILGPYFYMHHPYLSFLFITWTMYFWIGFVLGYFGGVCALFLEKSYQIILAILILYFFDIYLFEFLGNLIDWRIHVFSLRYGFTGSFSSVLDFWTMHYSLLFPFLLGTIGLIAYMKRGDVFAK